MTIRAAEASDAAEWQYLRSRGASAIESWEATSKSRTGLARISHDIRQRAGKVSAVILSRRSAAKDLKLRRLRSFAVYAAQDDGLFMRNAASIEAHRAIGYEEVSRLVCFRRDL